MPAQHSGRLPLNGARGGEGVAPSSLSQNVRWTSTLITGTDANSQDAAEIAAARFLARRNLIRLSTARVLASEMRLALPGAAP